MPEQVISIEYGFSSTDEPQLNRTLSAMQAEIGGQRKPWFMKAGAIDLLTYLELTITFIISSTLIEVIKNYLAGLAGAEKAKKLGEHHNEIITKWLCNIKTEVNKVLMSIYKQLKLGINVPKFENLDESIALRINMEGIDCYVVLNNRYVSDSAFEQLPDAIVNLIQYIINFGLPEDTSTLQLCVDPESKKWRYLLIPSYQGFGSFIDRVIDLSSGQIIKINSRFEFIKLLGATREDGLQFLVDPFRYPEKNESKKK